jgi:hypothetical protein
MNALLLVVLACAAPARADDQAAQRLQGAADLSQAAAATADPGAARDGAGAALDGNATTGDAVDGRGSIRHGAALSRPTVTAGQHPGADVPTPDAKDGDGHGKVSNELMLGGAAVLGGLQGWFAAGVVGAAAGAGLGLAAAWLFSRKDYGGAFGVTAGAIIGTAFGGPIGGLIGAAVGGIVGHFLGKLFL